MYYRMLHVAYFFGTLYVIFSLLFQKNQTTRQCLQTLNCYFDFHLHSNAIQYLNATMIF